MIPLSRETAKFLNFLKFQEKDSIVTIKDIKAVLKTPYKVLTDGTQIKNLKMHYLYKRWDDLGEHGM